MKAIKKAIIKLINFTIRVLKYIKRIIEPPNDSSNFFIKNYNQTLWGSITIQDEAGIQKAIELARSFEGPIVEIGSLFGHTAQLMLCTDNTKIVIAIDDFSWNPFGLSIVDHRTFYLRSMRFSLKSNRFALMECKSSEFFQNYSGTVPSLIFIDAGHDYQNVIFDILKSIEKDIPIIAGHDYTQIHPGVVQAVDEVFGENIGVYGTVWIAKNFK